MATLRQRPFPWHVTPDRVRSEWRWFWGKALIAPAFWRPGPTIFNYANKTWASAVSMAMGTWERDRGFRLGATDDDRIEFDSTILDGKEDLTFFWRGTMSSAALQPIWSAADASFSNTILMMARTTELRVFLGTLAAGSTDLLFSGATPKDGEFHTWCVERNQTASTATLYLDNAESFADHNTGLSWQTISIDPGGLMVGQDQDSVGGGFQNTQKLVGLIDNLYVFDGIISAGQRRMLFDDPDGPFREAFEPALYFLLEAAAAPAGDVRPRFHHHRHHNRAA